ncbi:MAG: alpha/beta hydrolase [Chloroflexi bacterium]|nr:alpha/beta hydrolase [Chloroflexota bacterium]
MPEAVINGFRMYYETHGSGQPLVMIHGGLGGGEGCAQTMEHHADILSGSFQVISYDRRAAGRSETPQDGYSIPNYAEDLRSLLDHLGVGTAHILGSSAGGPIALQFALENPERTLSLLLINTMTYVQESERVVRQRELDEIKQVLADQGKDAAVEAGLNSRWPGMKESDPAQFARLKAINLEQFDGIVKTIQSYLDIQDSLESRLNELTMPSMIVHGDADSRINIACGLQLHQGIAGSEFHVIPGAEHGLLTIEARRTRGMIEEFLAETAAQLRI